MNYRPILLSAAFLGLFAVVGTAFVAMTESGTRETIIENEKQVLLRNLQALLPPDRFDNDIVSDTKIIAPSTLLGTEESTLAYRARLAGEPVAVILSSIAANGYNGKIHLLVGINSDASIAAVRVVKHAETPGLGDGIEIRKSSWITQFDAQSLTSPAASEWNVKQDGGKFDALTGATITPRAIVKAVKHSLQYFEKNSDMLFSGLNESKQQ